jgi:hypothetical protein
MTEYEENEETRWQHLKDRLTRSEPTEAPDEILHLARAVAGVPDSQMTHEECRSWLPAYVDAEIGGLAVGEIYLEVKRHLDLCRECEAEYLDMLELAIAEDTGQLPVPETFPASDLSFLPMPSLAEYVRSAAEDIVSTAVPYLLDDLQAIADVFFEQVGRLGRRFRLDSSLAPAMGFGAGDVPEALRFLAAAYIASQSLVEAVSPQEIEAQIRTSQLRASLYQRAEQAALEVGLSGEKAQTFADKYAEFVLHDPQAFRALLGR